MKRIFYLLLGIYPEKINHDENINFIFSRTYQRLEVVKYQYYKYYKIFNNADKAIVLTIKSLR